MAPQGFVNSSTIVFVWYEDNVRNYMVLGDKGAIVLETKDQTEATKKAKEVHKELKRHGSIVFRPVKERYVPLQERLDAEEAQRKEAPPVEAQEQEGDVPVWAKMLCREWREWAGVPADISDKRIFEVVMHEGYSGEPKQRTGEILALKEKLGIQGTELHEK